MSNSEIIAQAAEYLDVFTSKMEKMPDTANVKRLVAELYAIAASAGDAPAVQGEPVAWVTADTVDGQIVNGKPRRIWWENNEGVGIPIYAAPQPAEQQPAPDVETLVEALEQCITSMLDSGYRANAVVIRAARAALAPHRKQGGEA